MTTRIPGRTARQATTATAWLVSGFLLACPVTAGDLEPPPDLDNPVSADAMMASLGEVARLYGPHAVILQTALLNEAVRNGSILEARVEKPAVERRDGKKYIAFVLESGIVFNDRSVSASERVQRTWREIVAAALRRLTEIELRADGVAVCVGYHHRSYADEQQLRAELPAGRGEAERLSFYVPMPDASRLARGESEADEVLPRVVVLRGEEVLPAVGP
jgi:hypothetical protein